MSTTRTHSEKAALASFVRAVELGAEGGYPDSVRIVAAGELSLDRIVQYMDDTILAGKPLIFVRDDGAEMFMVLHQRRFLFGLLDRLLRRVRITIHTRFEQDPEQEEERYVRPDHVKDLRGLVPAGC